VSVSATIFCCYVRDRTTFQLVENASLPQSASAWVHTVNCDPDRCASNIRDARDQSECSICCHALKPWTNTTRQRLPYAAFLKLHRSVHVAISGESEDQLIANHFFSCRESAFSVCYEYCNYFSSTRVDCLSSVLPTVTTTKQTWMNEMKWKCSDLKSVRKPTRSRLSLTHHANKSSRWAE